jgi:hypothetical protein
MFDFLDKANISTIVLISKKNKSVSIHFSGFETDEDAKNFSTFITEELGIKSYSNLDPLQIPPNTTIH